MMVFVDTSVWSLALRKDGPANHSSVKTLQRLLNESQNIVLIGLILQEILQGFKQEQTFLKITQYFDPIPLLPLTRCDFVAAANIRRRARTRGVTLSTPDCQIAAAAINHHCHHVLTTDKDCSRVAKWTPLQALQLPSRRHDRTLFHAHHSDIIFDNIKTGATSWAKSLCAI